MEPIIEIKNLTHIYSPNTPFEQRALDQVNLTIYRGEYLGIIGRTGSGKSTLIQHLNGLIRPTEGEVLFQGQDIWSSKELTHNIRFQVGLVFQYPEYQLFEETVYKDIAFGPRNMKLDEQEIDRRVRQAAAFAGLSEEILARSPFELSGGQKRRVAIAGVIAILGVSALAALSGSAEGTGLLYASSILVTVASVIQFIAGIKGIGACSAPQKAASCVKWGIIIAILAIISIIIGFVGGGQFSITSLVLNLLLPGLYVYGAMQMKGTA